MKKLVLEVYNLKESKMTKHERLYEYDFSKPIFKTYHFDSDTPNDEIIQFMDKLRSYNVVYIYEWYIKEL